MRFDDVLEEIGGYGLFQKYVFYLTCPINAVNAFYVLSPVFILGIPEHRYDNENSSNVKVECDEWVYDKSVFKDTFVSNTDLVCGDAVWVAPMGMLFYFGMVVGAIVSGVISDRFGRRVTMFVSIFLMCGSAVGLAFANSIALFGILQFMLGATNVAAVMPAYVISIEVTSTSKRMWPGVASSFPYSFSFVLYAGVAYGFRSMLPIQLTTWLLSLVLLSYWWLMPESPRWLLSKGRITEAGLIIRKAALWNNMSLPDKIFDDRTIEDIFEQDKTVSCFNLLSTRKMLSRSLLTYFNWATCSFVYFGLALNTGNLHGDLYLNFAIGGLVEFPAYLLVLLLIDRIGRRPMYIITMATGAVSCISTLLVIQYGNGLEALIVTFAMIGRFGSTSGLAVLYIFTAEIFPTVLRNTGLGSASLFASVGTMIAPYIVNWGENMGGNYGRMLPLSLFGGLAMLSAILTLFLPEPLNKQLPETVEDGRRIGKG